MPNVHQTLQPVMDQVAVKPAKYGPQLGPSNYWHTASQYASLSILSNQSTVQAKALPSPIIAAFSTHTMRDTATEVGVSVQTLTSLGLVTGSIIQISNSGEYILCLR